MTEADLPHEVEIIGRPVRARLARVLDDALDEWVPVDPELERPLRSIRRLVLAGGKRLRPAFCYWAFIGAGGCADDPAIVEAGAALELLHAFALVHDDVMDESVRRRGAPTVHVEFERLHRAEGWSGDPRRFGDGVAILVGDLAHVLANQLTERLGEHARRVWNRLAVEVNIGQYLDVVGTARGAPDLATARRISRYKSGKYTIERPLHLGAAIAGELERLGAPLSAYGEPLGEAFQLRDDLLGVFGDPAVMGKPVGEDLLEGKPTPLLAVARQRCTGEEAALLDRAGDRTLDAGELDALRDLLDSCGARAEIERSIEELTARAIDAANRAPLPDEARTALVRLAGYVATRDR
ncbi:MAG: polyprenyl synthetase family protein [Acidimicrobiales bacterium]